MEAASARNSNGMFKMTAACLLGFALNLPATAANPCGPKNPCAAKNACGMKNPCAAAASMDPKLVTRPKGTKPFVGNRAELVSDGEKLWKSTSLSTNGMACATCHQNGGAFNASFAKPYPHAVEMPQSVGLKQVTAEQMVQFCLVRPMAAKPLAWSSRELAALTAYTGEVQKAFIKTGATSGGAAANACGARNPCGMKNPCAGKNPCAAKPH